MGETVEYDLVVIGAGQLGLEAATRAAGYQARVALVSQGVAFDSRALRREVWLSAHWLSAHCQNRQCQKGLTTAAAINAWADRLIEQQYDLRYSPEVLALAGVEVIDDVGRFSRQPRLSLQVGGRVLRSRRYLLALPHVSTQDQTPGLWRLAETLPDRILVREDWPMARALARLGVAVTLVMKGFDMDQGLAQWLQAQMEAQGIQVWIGDGKFEPTADRLWQPEVLQSPNYADLNLPARFGQQGLQHGMWRDALARTSNRQIYAVHSETELDGALHNALFLANRRLPDSNIFHQPEIAAWGLDETQGRRRYGKDLMVLRQERWTGAMAQMQGSPEGFCQVLVRRNGAIVGAQIAGAGSEALLAAVMGQENITGFRQFAGLGELAVLVDLSWEWERRRSGSGVRQDVLESFFAWTRNWR
jgi:hypothetical protein